MRLLVVLAFAVLLVGCTAPPVADVSTPSDEERTSIFSVERAGRIILRPGIDAPPAAQHEGDRPTFCFDVPPGTVRFEGVLTWDTPQEMWLQFNPQGEPNDPPHAEGVSPPLRVTVDKPPSGEWFGYAGPSAVGGAVNYQLNITFEVLGTASAADVFPEPEKTCY